MAPPPFFLQVTLITCNVPQIKRHMEEGEGLEGRKGWIKENRGNIVKARKCACVCVRAHVYEVHVCVKL